MSTYRILSLDGGGIRGLVTAIVLERLLAEKSDLIEKVDLIAGTSTGGILALGLARGKTPKELRELYEKKAKTIFDDSIWDDVVDLFGLAGAEYGNKGLEKELIAALGENTKLKQLPRRVLITAFDLDGIDPETGEHSWKPKLFHNFPGEDSDGGELAWKVGLYTSAAPTFFPSVDGYIDGGVYANNPSMVALAQTQDVRTHASPPAFEDIRLLSLGTGTELTYIGGERHNWGYAQWAEPLVRLMLDGAVGIAHYQCKMILDKSYHRLAPTFPPGKSFPIDGVDKIKDLIKFAEDPHAVDITKTVAWLKASW